MTHNVVPRLFFSFPVAQLAGRRERETGNKVEQRRADERDWNKAELSIPVPTFGFGKRVLRGRAVKPRGFVTRIYSFKFVPSFYIKLYFSHGTLRESIVLLSSISEGSMMPSTYTIWYCLHLICLRDRRRCRKPELLLWISSNRLCICLAECEGSNNKRYKPPSFPECSSTPITNRLCPGNK